LLIKLPLFLTIKNKGGDFMRAKKVLNIQIGERIHIAREQANMTQEKLSEYVKP